MPKPRRTPRASRSVPNVTTTPVPFSIPPNAQRALVVRAHGLWFEVALEANPTVWIATLRGALKRNRQRTDIVAVGDWVWVIDAGENEGRIEAVEPRVRSLTRLARNTRDVEQVIIANLDQVLFVFAAHEPEPHRRMLDRFLILAELQSLPILIGVAKMDLDCDQSDVRARSLFADYEAIYPVLYFSAVTGDGIDTVRSAIDNKVTVIAGPSGVGKSSLLNVLDPENRRAVSSVSQATGKGRHTTIGARLHRIDDRTYLGDTPGMRALAMRAIPGEALPACYREFLPFLGECGFNDCTHVHEPECAVLAAVANGAIARARWESYVAIRTGDEIENAVIVHGEDD